MISKLKEFKIRYFVLFLIIIWLFTVVSSFINYYTLPQVLLANGYNGPLTLTINKEAEVEAADVKNLKSPLQGEVLKVFAREGDQLKVDQALYQYSMVGLKETLRQIENEVDQLAYDVNIQTLRNEKTSNDAIANDIAASEKKMKDQLRNYELQQSLYALGSISKKALDESKDAYDQEVKNHGDRLANLEITRLENQKQLQSLRTNYNKKVKEKEALEIIIASGGIVKAKEEGIVKSIDVKTGEVIAKDARAFAIEDLSADRIIKIEVMRDIAKYYTTDDTLSITAPGFENEIKGQIVTIKRHSSNKKLNVITVKLLADKPIASGKQVSVYGNKKSQYYPVLIPKHAVMKEQRKSYVWTVKEVKKGFTTEYVLEKLMVVTGDVDNESIVVKSGLSLDDHIVTRVENNKTLSNRQQVIIKSNE